MMPLTAYRVAASLLPVLLVACGGRGAELPPLPTCGSARADALTDADTLDVLVRIAEAAPSELLIRVDPPGESDIQFPDGAPASVAAAALSVTSRGMYQVCAAESAAAVLFDAETTPHGRAWLRVTTLRPVRARFQVGGGAEGGDGSGRVVILPGASGRTGVVEAP